ncbi:MAG: vitamin B12-dependent ribonucleotide reductase [Planctomycetes bacterium]|nr:vitamin B12-dependent ribonucleotide reductase [Planctomycetota bacterium]
MSVVTADRTAAVAVEAQAVEPVHKLSENAQRVLQARYLKKNEQGEVLETATDMFRRVARTIAAAELNFTDDDAIRSEWEGVFYDMMTAGEFMPNSPTLMNSGRDMGMLSACFVLPVRDSIEEIFDAVKYTALIQKAGGGTGFAFDELRPTGDFISSSGGRTSGPISFWRVFSEATNAIQQGAFRRGANMGMMYVHHPDILKFLHAKQDLTQFTNYNISVKVTDKWMKGFLEDPDSPHVVVNPRNGDRYVMPRDLDIWGYDIRTLTPLQANASQTAAEVYSKRDIWNIIVDNAWRTGEPGVVFMDRVNEFNPTPNLGRMESTNPCGEQPLLPYEACNLGSINLGLFVTEECTESAGVNWDRLRTCVHHSVRFLDNVIEANNYGLPQIDAICKSNRKIGLGVMGFADALFKLGVRYNSEDGVLWGERFMKFVNDEAHNYSEKLAEERGCFPNWEGSLWQTRWERKQRNACSTTVAPTGTISIIADCSGGIEPLFSLAFYRNVLKGERQGDPPMVETNPVFKKVAQQRGFLSEGLMERIATDGTLAHYNDVPADVRRVFVCAHDIEPEWHIRMQAAFQKHNDSSISKTINFPHDAKPEDVESIYRMAFELNCKGVTVYRDGCRASQPMALKDSDKKHAAEPKDAKVEDAPVEPKDLPEILSGLRIRQMTPFGNMHVKITVDPKKGKEQEVFAQLGKGGDLANSDLEAICRMVSLWLRSGGSLKHVINQLKDIGSSLQVSTKEGKIMSLGDGLARALKTYQKAKDRFGLENLLLGRIDLAELDRPPTAGSGQGNGNGAGNGNGKRNGQSHGLRATPIPGMPVMTGDTGILPPITGTVGYKVQCPECSSPLYHSEGCMKCETCGYAQC